MTLHFSVHSWHFALTLPLLSIPITLKYLSSSKAHCGSFSQTIELGFLQAYFSKAPNQTNALHLEHNLKIRFLEKFRMIIRQHFILAVATLRITKTICYHSVKIPLQNLNILFTTICYCTKC